MTKFRRGDYVLYRYEHPNENKKCSAIGKIIRIGDMKRVPYDIEWSDDKDITSESTKEVHDRMIRLKLGKYLYA